MARKTKVEDGEELTGPRVMLMGTSVRASIGGEIVPSYSLVQFLRRSMNGRTRDGFFLEIESLASLVGKDPPELRHSHAQCHQWSSMILSLTIFGHLRWQP